MTKRLCSKRQRKKNDYKIKTTSKWTKKKIENVNLFIRFIFLIEYLEKTVTQIFKVKFTNDFLNDFCHLQQFPLKDIVYD